MRVLSSTLILIFASCLLVQKEVHAQVIGSLGQNLLFESGNNGRSIDTRQPLALRGGYRFDAGDLYLEYSKFRSAQGTPSVQVVREHGEWLMWARRIFSGEMKFAPYAAGGAGVQRDEVETTIPGETKKDRGEFRPVVAIAGGFHAVVRGGLELQLEAKTAASSSYAPNPLMGLAFFVGYQF